MADDRVLSDDDITTTWMRGGGAGAHLSDRDTTDPDGSDADGTDSDSDSTDSDSDARDS